MQDIMVAADTDNLDAVVNLASALKDEPHFAGVKVGFSLALRYGLHEVVSRIRRVYETGLVIYDHQKAGNDIPDTGDDFARIMDEAHVDGAILFPFVGPDTSMRWIEKLQEVDVMPIVGGSMTHPRFEEWIPTATSMTIYRTARFAGVTRFVVPGNKPDVIKQIRDTLTGYDYHFYAPGLVTQGGDITEAGRLCGPNFTAIVGRALLGAADPVEAFKTMAARLE